MFTALLLNSSFLIPCQICGSVLSVLAHLRRHSSFQVTLSFSRQLVAWHRPFCVDLEESTFTYLRNFLESYCDGIGNDTPPAPFLSKRYETTL